MRGPPDRPSLARARDAPGLKLVIQIPCYDEGETLAGVLSDLPERIEGFDHVEVLVIDDGSTDDTAKIARQDNRQLRNLSLIHI